VSGSHWVLILQHVYSQAEVGALTVHYSCCRVCRTQLIVPNNIFQEVLSLLFIAVVTTQVNEFCEFCDRWVSISRTYVPDRSWLGTTDSLSPSTTDICTYPIPINRNWSIYPSNLTIHKELTM
jgi:hypothetical protein